MSVDTSQLLALSADLGKASLTVTLTAAKVVAKSALDLEAAAKQAAPSEKTPSWPATGSTRPTTYGPINEPIRPIDEAKPAPVARERVGYSSGV